MKMDCDLTVRLAQYSVYPRISVFRPIPCLQSEVSPFKSIKNKGYLKQELGKCNMIDMFKNIRRKMPFNMVVKITNSNAFPINVNVYTWD